jgi:AcrR family transcriptional regulator
MGVQERRAREKKELRQEILDAARDLFLREGFEHVSMRKIAEKIEYSPTTIYLYFQHKADMVDCLCEETLARLVRKQTQIDEAIADPVERLRRCLRSYIEFGLKHPNHYKMSFMMSELFDDPDRAVRSRAMGERAFDHLRQGLAQCVQQKSIAVADIEATAQVLWATIHGLTSLLIAKPKFPWVERERLIDTLVENAINGLRCNTPA